MDIFRNGTKEIPRQDKQIVRVRMTDMDVAARKDHITSIRGGKSGEMDIVHTESKS